LPFGADLARDARHFGCERAQLVDHLVDGLLELEDLAAHVDRDLARQVAVRDRDRDLRDVAHLAGQVARHRVDVVGEILPDAADVLDLRLTAELALGADLARDARDFGGKPVQLVDHRVDGLLELADLSAHVDGDLAERSPRAIAVATSAMLRTCAVRLPAIEFTLSVRSFQVPATPGHERLAAELAFRADLARDARHFGCERAQLVDHRVDGFLELLDLAADVDRDLARQRSPLAMAVATSAMLRTWPVRLPAIELTLSVRSFQVPVAPGHERLAAELAFGADLRATRVTSDVNTFICSIIVFAMVAERRKSPLSGRPSTSTRTFFERSPLATAVIVRVTSVTGHSRSSISTLAEFSMAPHAPERGSIVMRCRVLPSLPTIWLARSISRASRWFEITISLKVSATLP
jgi:hypothetical protein